MNTSYFVLVSVLLTFATGFFVASIIWGISWFLSPREERQFAEWLSGIFNSKPDNSEKKAAVASGFSDEQIEESEYNQELYQYHHGEN